ncbi:MAG TPA: multifunctional oxoglutarate decarboxylase/oxoglutarate dehydrogenase thiamine pyrophosphate-binding subunit/dihydrolipoyllysine-residue succinyltransferase subunit [Gemmatimonadales bacterium]|nr:multifunctional oxoglutarate decarboxylase/oxoglutarate dehydrogenase thiamine pyrophosphate-binding subunit/dihydrolipoyllysine-residue succinyltransferase subunit [Gemmatimonadales bacterium]
MSEFVFGTHNAAFVQVMYEQYLRDPGSVGEEWRQLFDNGKLAELPVIPTEREEVRAAATAATPVSEAAERAGGGASAAPPPAAPAPSGAPAALAASAIPGLTPISGPAARLAENMTASLSVPTATSFREIAVEVLDGRRKALNAQLAAAGKKVSYTHLVGYAIVRAARDYPVMTHVFEEVEGKPYRRDPQGVNLGLAVDVERKDGRRALVVPVIRHAESLDFAAFHATYETLVEKARANRLLPDDFAGATITLTNPGTLGTVASVPRLLKGQGSIIATGAIRQIGSTRLMTITSTYDHRIIQGAESGLFLRRLEALLQGADGFYERVFESLGLAAAVAGQGPALVAPVVAGRDTAITLGAPAAPVSGASLEDVKYVAAAMALVKAFRNFGHMAARLDPLGSEPPGDPALDPAPLGLTPEIMARIPAEVLRVYVPGRTLAEAYPRLQETYCGTISYEVEHIGSHQERVWLRQVIESGEHRRPLAADEKRKLLARLTAVEGLERFLHRAYLGQKRFSIEGLDALVPMLDETVELAGASGARRVVLGMAHRGRLNVLAHVVGLPYETIFAEFEGGRHVEETLTPEGGTGDVKYHHGAEGVYQTAAGKPVNVTLSPNPSHLEAVNPVVEGRARANQTNRRGKEAIHDASVAVPVLIHGDASFAAQGVVAETFNLARLKGYTTGGTIHLIANNQLGFTTEAREGRSTDYSSDLAKGFDVPIIHVNADDAEACLAAARLSMLYRNKFHGDVVIDVVGYRRHGHNEGDEPAYTQPLMYERIKQTPTVRERYAGQLAREGVVAAAEAATDVEQMQQRLADVQQSLKAHLEGVGAGEEPQRISGAQAAVAEPETAVAASVLTTLNEQLLTVPSGFTVIPKLKKQLERRREALTAGEIDWAHGEALALASLVVEGTSIRLTGQDTERGTFSQRHLVLHDATNGRRFAPIQNLPAARAPFELHNSPLSEFACLAFEYGYAAAAPDALVLWEAQYGDFTNGGEVIIDQFLIAGLAKWGQTSRLTLLLPHGYEGQGPEHSSARIERFLALGAEGNLRIANCTTPAQYFHLLRRQARHAELRPLVLFTPKSLLRLPQAASRVEQLTSGGFRPVLDDPAGEAHRNATRLVLCSGKVFYDLSLSPRRAEAPHVAIGRVELLYPFPAPDVAELIRRYPDIREIVWVQEEPRNMGPQKFMLPQLRELVPADVAVRDIGRPERSSPAEGYPAAHQVEQARIVAAALAR